MRFKLSKYDYTIRNNTGFNQNTILTLNILLISKYNIYITYNLDLKKKNLLIIYITHNNKNNNY